MTGKLLDTNAVIAMQHGDSNLKQILQTSPNILVPSIVIGELYFGAVNSMRMQANFTLINEFVADNVILSVDAITARYYATVRYNLKQKGRPIPENDMWIASLALQHQLILLTDDKHFAYVDNIQIQSWKS